MKATREWAIAGALAIAILGSGGFMLTYGLHAAMWMEGASAALALAGLCLAALGWSNWIVGTGRVVDRIDTYPSEATDREEASDELACAERSVSRDGALVRLLYVALGAFGLATLFPFRSWGPAPGGALFHTKWKRGDRLVLPNGRVVTKDALEVDSIATVFPEGAAGDPSSQTVLIRLPAGLGGSVDGYVAFSKICTHAGCPVALYRAEKRQLMCPCHQSIFDVLDAGKVVSGPADHALPQLPLEIGEAGDLRATGDYPVPVGPGFWERG